MNTFNPTAGVIYEQHSSGVHIHRLKDTRRDTIDAWLEMVNVSEVAAAKANEPILFLVDIRGRWITPYTIARVRHSVSRTPPGIIEWVGVLAGDNLLARTIETLIRRLPASIQLTTRIFLKEDDAIAWLVEQRQAYEQGKTQG